VNKITCVLFATHHNSSNIASLRFKILIKYMDVNKYEFIILTRWQDEFQDIEKFENVTVIPVKGELFGQGTRLNNFKNLMYFLLNLNTKKLVTDDGFIDFKNCWAINAVQTLEGYLPINSRENCLVMGTYSPIDALIAASKLSEKYKLPLMQDFRDGFLFESLGRKSLILSWLRKKLESVACKNSQAIFSVSNALVDDFKYRYPKKNVHLLHNGFDPEDFSEKEDYKDSNLLKLLSIFESDKYVIGHFGRISASDATRWNSLSTYLKTISKSDVEIKSTLRLFFMGELNNDEISLIENSGLDYVIAKPADRRVALALMKKCDYLLLLTGDGVGCATGKIFEYINAGAKVICFSGVENEASKILKDTLTGETFINGAENIVKDFCTYIKAYESVVPNYLELNKYNKINQAKDYERIIEHLLAKFKEAD
jgi:glycosyltransferase involved in cell wall biosynthesis